jgi:hypothetical protein
MPKHTVTPVDIRRLLVDALMLVALPAEQQVAVLRDLEVSVEVAEGFDYGYRQVPSLCDWGVLTVEQVGAVVRLAQHFDLMWSGYDKDELLSVKAVVEDKRWETSRELARDALAKLGEKPRMPTFEGQTRVPAAPWPDNPGARPIHPKHPY